MKITFSVLSIRNIRLVTVLMLFSLLLRVNITDAQNVAVPSGTLNGSERLKAEIGMSFLLDVCGDAQLGNDFREILMTWIMECPFDNATKERLRYDNLLAIQDAKASMIRNGDNQSGPPERILSGQGTCTQFLSNKASLEKNIIAFKAGKISSGEVIKESCDDYKITTIK